MRRLALLAAVVVAGAVVGDAAAAFPGQNGVIVFAREADQNPGIYVVNPDGTGLKRIVATANPNVFAPQWSPDGTSIVYGDNTDFPSSTAVRVVDAAGTLLRTVVGATYPSWSPDGRVWFMLHDTGSCAYVEGSAQPQFCVVAPPGQVFGGLREFGKWSSTGRYAWVGSRLPISGAELGDQIDIVQPGVTQIVAGAGGEFAVSATRVGPTFDWSPDGTKLAFWTRSGGLGIVGADGTGEHLLGVKGSEPAWSPDGTKLVFKNGEGLAIVRTEGSQLVQLTHDSGDDFPDWQASTTAYQPPAAVAKPPTAKPPVVKPASKKKPKLPAKKKKQK